MTTANRSSSYPTVAPAPGAISHDRAVLKLWGDAGSGYVSDEVYVSNERIHLMVFSLPPGGRFVHSDRSRTYFSADELYYVLTGSMFLSNPETGEVHLIEEGEAIHFGPDVWHHGFNAGSTELRVLELFAPPPATGTSQAYARTKPNLDVCSLCPGPVARSLASSSRGGARPRHAEEDHHQRQPLAPGGSGRAAADRDLAQHSASDRRHDDALAGPKQ